jgi:hypothetical protein
VSTEFNPFKNSSTNSYPYYNESGKTPTALDTEKRPPTQSQNPKTFSSLIPKLLVAERFVLTAHMCEATAVETSATPSFS